MITQSETVGELLLNLSVSMSSFSKARTFIPTYQVCGEGQIKCVYITPRMNPLVTETYLVLVMVSPLTCCVTLSMSLRHFMPQLLHLERENSNGTSASIGF